MSETSAEDRAWKILAHARFDEIINTSQDVKFLTGLLVEEIREAEQSSRVKALQEAAAICDAIAEKRYDCSKVATSVRAREFHGAKGSEAEKCGDRILRAAGLTRRRP